MSANMTCLATKHLNFFLFGGGVGGVRQMFKYMQATV